MSRWWRPCQFCGASGEDARRCSACGAIGPFTTQRQPYDDWRLLGGCLGLALVLVIVILLIGMVAIHVSGL